jgi:hypothetical protein
MEVCQEVITNFLYIIYYWYEADRIENTTSRSSLTECVFVAAGTETSSDSNVPVSGISCHLCLIRPHSVRVYMCI